MPSTQFSHLTQSELKAALLTRLKAASNLKKESRQLRNRLRDLRSELLAIEVELKQIQEDIGSDSNLAGKIMWCRAVRRRLNRCGDGLVAFTPWLP